MAVAVLPLRTQLPWYSHSFGRCPLCGLPSELVQMAGLAPFLSYGWCWGSCCCRQGFSA